MSKTEMVDVDLRLSKTLDETFKSMAKSCGVPVKHFIQVILFMQAGSLKKQQKDLEWLERSEKRQMAPQRMAEAEERLEKDSGK